MLFYYVIYVNCFLLVFSEYSKCHTYYIIYIFHKYPSYHLTRTFYNYSPRDSPSNYEIVDFTKNMQN